MMSNEFEKALDAFLEGAEADEAHQALYDIIRAAFLAGWRSAGGDLPQEQKLRLSSEAAIRGPRSGWHRLKSAWESLTVCLSAFMRMCLSA